MEFSNKKLELRSFETFKNKKQKSIKQKNLILLKNENIETSKNAK